MNRRSFVQSIALLFGGLFARVGLAHRKPFADGFYLCAFPSWNNYQFIRRGLDVSHCVNGSAFGPFAAGTLMLYDIQESIDGGDRVVHMQFWHKNGGHVRGVESESSRRFMEIFPPSEPDSRGWRFARYALYREADFGHLVPSGVRIVPFMTEG